MLPQHTAITLLPDMHQPMDTGHTMATEGLAFFPEHSVDSSVTATVVDMEEDSDSAWEEAGALVQVMAGTGGE